MKNQRKVCVTGRTIGIDGTLSHQAQKKHITWQNPSAEVHVFCITQDSARAPPITWASMQRPKNIYDNNRDWKMARQGSWSWFLSLFSHSD